MAKVPVLLISIFLIRGILLFFGDYLTRKTGSAVIRDLRADLHGSLIYQAPSFYRRHQTGEVLSRLLNDVHLIKLMSTQVFADFFRVSAMAPAMLILVLLYDWKLTHFALVSPALAAAIQWAGSVGVFCKAATTIAVTESATPPFNSANRSPGAPDHPVLLDANRSRSIGSKRRSLGLFKVDLQAGRAAAASGPIIEVVGAVAGGVLFYYAGRGIASGVIDPGNFIVVLGGLAFLFMSARRLNQINVEVQPGHVGREPRVRDDGLAARGCGKSRMPRFLAQTRRRSTSTTWSTPTPTAKNRPSRAYN